MLHSRYLPIFTTIVGGYMLNVFNRSSISPSTAVGANPFCLPVARPMSNKPQINLNPPVGRIPIPMPPWPPWPPSSQSPGRHRSQPKRRPRSAILSRAADGFRLGARLWPGGGQGRPPDCARAGGLREDHKPVKFCQNPTKVILKDSGKIFASIMTEINCK